MQDLGATWAIHKNAGWPRVSSPHEGQLMTLDTVISGCVVYVLEHEERLDLQRVAILESCLSELDDILPELPEGDSQEYFDRLKTLGRLLLSPWSGQAPDASG